MSTGESWGKMVANLAEQGNRGSAMESGESAETKAAMNAISGYASAYEAARSSGIPAAVELARTMKSSGTRMRLDGLLKNDPQKAVREAEEVTKQLWGAMGR